MARTSSLFGRPGPALAVFFVFLRLGLTAFGGPAAHLGYFREAFVVRRRWLGEAAYGELVALCQLLPGPASSQVGFALGLLRAGFPGAIAAFVGFTLPSAAILVLLALGSAHLSGGAGQGVFHGLKLVAVPVVAAAVWGMARTLTPDVRRGAIAVLAFGLLLAWKGAAAPPAAIALGACLGLLACRDAAGRGAADREPVPVEVSKATAVAALVLFALLLLGPPVWSLFAGRAEPSLFEGVYRAGALVFGGGHVVLPLLEEAVVASGRLDAERFLVGYGAAQAMPGPLFSFAAYLGALVGVGGSALLGALVALAAIFLPGFLLLVGALPFWRSLARRPGARAAVAGANAAVVGLLAAALWDPVAKSAIGAPADLALAALGFVALAAFRAPPVLVVLAVALGGAGLARF